MIHFYDTATRAKRPFEPLEKGKARIYTCGPTVWDYAHIGNFRSFMFADVLKRYLRFRGFDVRHVMNLTDVDDRIAQKVSDEGVSLREFTDRYVEAFFRDAESLNIEKADAYPRATDHIDEMISLISSLLERGVAYERSGSVYYAIKKFPEYGKFAQLDVSGMQDGVRIDTDKYDKDNVRDFVLWKAWTEEDGDVVWDSPFGRGRPGWHLECSAMSTKYLGPLFDIHTGGIDLVFPHHQNEIAQSESAFGKPFVRYWMHNEFMNIGGREMSKSSGNQLLLKDIGGADDIAGLRYMVVSAHYRTTCNFTTETLEASKSALVRLTRLRRQLSARATAGDGVADDHLEDNQWTAHAEAARSGLIEAMDDDLNAPRAFAALFGLVSEAEKALRENGLSRAGAHATGVFLDEMDQVFGIFNDRASEADRPRELDAELSQLLTVRNRAREAKDWETADRLRAELEKRGIAITDTPDGTSWAWV